MQAIGEWSIVFISHLIHADIVGTQIEVFIHVRKSNTDRVRYGENYGETSQISITFNSVESSLMPFPRWLL